MLGVVLVFAAIQLAVGTFCFCRARGGSAEKVIAGLAGVAAIGLGLISTFMSAALALQALAIVVLGLVGLALRIRLKSYLIASTVATIILFAVIGSWNFSENRELRQQYPFESLAQRLAYETESQRNTSLPMTAIENIATTEAEPNGAAALKYEMAPSYERIDVASHQSAVAANPTVAAAFYRLAVWETELDRSGSRWQSAMRTAALRNLHASQVEQFVNSPGFGVGRIRRPTKYDLKLRPPYPMPM